jgi:hypothetical protein
MIIFDSAKLFASNDVDGAKRMRRRRRRGSCKPASHGNLLVSVCDYRQIYQLKLFMASLASALAGWLACGMSVSEILLSISCAPSIKIALFKPQNRENRGGRRRRTPTESRAVHK